jgi:hypothetical protein
MAKSISVGAAADAGGVQAPADAAPSPVSADAATA